MYCPASRLCCVLSHCSRYLHILSYDKLYITSKEVTVRWSDTGEFKFSGTYGKYQPL